MDSSDALTFCKFSCGNNVHAKCMKVWAEHRKSNGDKITCPVPPPPLCCVLIVQFCREDWGPLALDDISKEIKNIRRPRHPPPPSRLLIATATRHLGATCRSCRIAPIDGPRTRCLVCQVTPPPLATPSNMGWPNSDPRRILTFASAVTPRGRITSTLLSLKTPSMRSGPLRRSAARGVPSRWRTKRF
jgi:hypothetical protein